MEYTLLALSLIDYIVLEFIVIANAEYKDYYFDKKNT